MLHFVNFYQNNGIGRKVSPGPGFQALRISLANVEVNIGQLYPATLLARLVTLELESRRGR